MEPADDRITYEAFRATIALTRQPQLIRISTDGVAAGHTMIVYRVTPDRLYIADPNYPGRLRTIRYDAAAGKLAPYSSGASASEIAANGATSYTHFAYVPWQSSKSEASVAAHWSEFEAGTAGDAVFPKYNIQALAGKDAQGKEVWAPLVDGYKTTEKKLDIRIRGVAPGHELDMFLTAFAGTSSKRLGPRVHLRDARPGRWRQRLRLLGTQALKDQKLRYVDFVRLTVTSGESTDWQLADVRVGPAGGSVNQDYTWSYQGDGRGGIATKWENALDTTTQTANLAATWEIPDSLTPGTDVDVSTALQLTNNFGLQAGSPCDGMQSELPGPEVSYLRPVAMNETGTDLDSVGKGVLGTGGQQISIPASVMLGCDTATGSLVLEKSGSGSFKVPDRLVAPAGQTPYLVIVFIVHQAADEVRVSYIYK